MLNANTLCTNKNVIIVCWVDTNYNYFVGFIYFSSLFKRKSLPTSSDRSKLFSDNRYGLLHGPAPTDFIFEMTLTDLSPEH